MIAEPRVAPAPGLVRVVDRGVAMGGRLEVHLAVEPARAGLAAADAARVVRRIRSWATPLSRHEPSSALTVLNADPRSDVPVRPALAAALAAAAVAADLTDGIVDVTLLDARLAAEAGAGQGEPGPGLRRATRSAGHRWHLQPGQRAGRATVCRAPGLRFDLGGIGKGLLADRALQLLCAHPGALVDADGDLAVRVAPGDTWQVAVGDPRDPGLSLAIVELPGPGRHGETSGGFGLATSGTSVHRWGPSGSGRHHLIDPRTGRPAVTDVAQATVLARTARTAEALAKAVVVLGAACGVDLLTRTGVPGAVLLLEDGRTVALPGTERYLA